MTPDLRARYLDLLKKSLTDYPHVDSAHANAMPLEWLAPKSPLKGVRDRALTALARRLGYSLGKGDRLDPVERARRRRGGAAIFMRAVLLAHGVEDRTIWACDSFAGLPPPEPDRYPGDAGDRHHTVPFLAVGIDQVRANFEKYDLLDDRVRFVDDYRLGPCREAVDEFRRARAVAEEIVDIDGLAAYWRKG